MDAEYYEVVACNIVNQSKVLWLNIGGDVYPKDLKRTSRERRIVVARQLCMFYRNNYLKMTFAITAGRYGKDHATALHAVKTIENLKKTDPVFRIDVNNFIKICLDMKKEKEEAVDLAKLLNPDSYGEHRQEIHAAIANMFTLIYDLYMFLTFEEDDNGTISQRIKMSKEALDKLEHLFDGN